MAALDKMLEWIIRMEGGYVNDPVDPGGETKYGISKKAYPTIDIKNLTPDMAKRLYKLDYYDKYCAGLDAVPAFLVFDCAVNSGGHRAITILQQALRITADGDLGPVTREAANSADIETVLKDYLTHRARFYHDLVESKPQLEKFLNGWFRRLFMLLHYMETEGFLNDND